MSAPSFIARKLRFKGRLPLICIALSFFIIVLAVAISAGFRREIRAGVSSLSGDIQIIPQQRFLSDEEQPIPLHPAYEEPILALDEVKALIPVISRVGIIKTADAIQGVLFKGVPGGADSTGCARIPRKLSQLLQIQEGAQFTVYFLGEKTKARRLKVEQVYEGILDTEDKLVVYLPLADMQRVAGWTGEQVGAFEILLKHPERAAEMKEEIGSLLFLHTTEDDTPVYCLSVTERYPQIFDWLHLIDSNVVFILILMIIVAGFNMISGLLILLFESISTIGALKAFGMADRGLRRVYLRLSAGIVCKGLLWGNALAIVFCLVQDRFHLLKLDPASYFVSHVPAQIDWSLLIGFDTIAFTAILFILQIPLLFISRIDPASTMRME
ncbi:MAG: ABC transporter permease [Bacteroidales bacterium]|nr:ABC transporter permease [Bacteroidales bacterium]